MIDLLETKTGRGPLHEFWKFCDSDSRTAHAQEAGQSKLVLVLVLVLGSKGFCVGPSSFLFCLFSFLDLSYLHLKWSWADLISFTRISLCAIRGIISALLNWCFPRAKKVRLLNLRTSELVVGLSLFCVSCLYEGCKGAVVSSWRPCRGPI